MKPCFLLFISISHKSSPHFTMDTACLDQLLSFEIGAMDTGQRLYNNAPSQGQSQRTTIVSRGAIVEVLRRAQKHLGTSSSIPRISPLTNITLNNSVGDDDPSSSRSGIVFTLSPAPYGWLGTSLRTKIASRDSEIALGVLQGKLACWKETIANMLETKTYPIEPLQYILFSQLTALIGVIHHWLDGAQASIRAWERAPETKESGRPDYFVQAMEDFLRSWVNLPVWEVKRTDVWGVRLSIRFAYWLMYYDIEMYLDQTTDLVCVDWQHERRIDAPDEGEPLLGDMERKLVETMLEQVSALVVRMQPPPDVIQDYPAVG